jgi:hypothetical protein
MIRSRVDCLFSWTLLPAAGPVIAKAKRHRYGTALRGCAEALPTLHPSPDAADTDADAAAAVDPYAGAATASALITGGTGALGVQTGLWLVARGASRVTLTAGPGALTGTVTRGCV